MMVMSLVLVLCLYVGWRMESVYLLNVRICTGTDWVGKEVEYVHRYVGR